MDWSSLKSKHIPPNMSLHAVRITPCFWLKQLVHPLSRNHSLKILIKYGQILKKYVTATTKHRHVIAYIKARDMSYPNILLFLPVVAWLLLIAAPKICYAHYKKCYVRVTIRD